MIDKIIVISYLTILLIIGYSSGKKINNSDTNSYISGTKKYNYFYILAGITATYIGGGFTIGLAEKVYTLGIGYIFGIWGYSLKEFILSQFVVNKFSKFKNANTIGDIIGSKLGKNSQIFTGILSVIVCCGIVGAQFSAFGYISETFFNINYLFSATLCALVVIFYVSFGGMNAVMAGDTVHFLILIVTIPITFVFGYIYSGGNNQIINSINFNFPNIIGSLTYLQIFGIFLAMLIGEVLVPPYVQKVLVSKNKVQAKKGTLLSALLSLLVFWLVGMIGIIALCINNNLNPNNALAYVVQTVLPIGIKGLAIAGILAAIMSSADAFLNSAGISLVNDVINKLKINKSKQSVVQYRNITIALGVFSLLIGASFVSVMDLLLFSYQFWTPIVVIPLIYILFRKPLTKKSFWFGSIVSLSVIVLANLFNSTWIPNSIFGIIANVVCLTITNKKIRPEANNISLLAQE
jgi:SSS family solute:Na+ symporter